MTTQQFNVTAGLLAFGMACMTFLAWKHAIDPNIVSHSLAAVLGGGLSFLQLPERKGT